MRARGGREGGAADTSPFSSFGGGKDADTSPFADKKACWFSPPPPQSREERGERRSGNSIVAAALPQMLVQSGAEALVVGKGRRGVVYTRTRQALGIVCSWCSSCNAGLNLTNNTHTHTRYTAGNKASGRYNSLLETAHKHRCAVASVIALTTPGSPTHAIASSDVTGAMTALRCWLDALDLADDDGVLQDNVRTLGYALGLRVAV